MSRGAQTPEDLEMLFEDSLVLRDGQTVAGLFEDGAVLVIDELSARGGQAISQLVLTKWVDGQTYVANPQYVTQARDIALIVSEQGINVVHRGSDGIWRYTIVLINFERSKNDSPRSR